MKNNCFAFKNKKCRILTEPRCNYENCSFYKTEDEQEESRKKVYTRLASLDKEVQRNIADTYYYGKYPWLEVGNANEC